MSVIGILGTIHSEAMRKEYEFTLDKMEKIILEFKPDIICAEIRPEDWKKHLDTNNYDGYLGPNEYRNSIIPLCEKNNIELVPVDWFEDDFINIDYFENKSLEETNRIKEEFEVIISEYLKIAKQSELPFNSNNFNSIVEKKQNFQNDINPKLHNVYWICRNQIMLRRVIRTMKENEGKRVLCTIGFEHAYFYMKELKDTNWEVVFPLDLKLSKI